MKKMFSFLLGVLLFSTQALFFLGCSSDSGSSDSSGSVNTPPPIQQ